MASLTNYGTNFDNNNNTTDGAFKPLSSFKSRRLRYLHQRLLKNTFELFKKIKWTLTFVPQTANLKVLYSQVVGVKFKL